MEIQVQCHSLAALAQQLLLTTQELRSAVERNQAACTDTLMTIAAVRALLQGAHDDA